MMLKLKLKNKIVIFVVGRKFDYPYFKYQPVIPLHGRGITGALAYRRIQCYNIVSSPIALKSRVGSING